MNNEPRYSFDGITAWKHFEPIGLAFLEAAAAKFVVEVETPLPRQQVWDAFANANTWQSWFPKVECVSYSGITPYGVGTTRRSVVDGVFYDETLLVWEEPCRWGYRIDRATKAIASAQLEITEFASIATGTRVKWILACDPLSDMPEQHFQKFLKNLLTEAIRNLEHLYATGEI
jgi:hypothetical protein